MKKIFIVLVIALSSKVYSQVAIGKKVNHPSALLDFEEGTYMGLLIPKVTNASQINTPGTLYVDIVLKQVCLKHKTGTTCFPSKQIHDIQPTIDAGSPRVVIGNEVNTSGIKGGALILESYDKALLLPKVEDAHLKINADAGMIVYDPKSGKVAISDGLNWSFWDNQ